MSTNRPPRRIVVVLPDAPLPFGNAAARWYYLLVKGLAERGHRVTAFVGYAHPGDPEAVRDLFPPGRYDLRLYPHWTPRSLRSKSLAVLKPNSYIHDARCRRELAAELARGFDVLHLEDTWSGWAGRAQAGRALLHVLYLLAIDASGESPVTTAGHRLRLRLALRAERRLLRRYPFIATLTPRLTEQVGAISPASAVFTVPLGLDLGLYAFDPAPPPSDRAPVVGLIGSFNWFPSLSAGRRLLERLWPEVKRRVPAARLQVVGRAARSALGDLAAGRPDVTLAQDVPDTLPYFLGTDVLLYAPSRGSGMKVKVLEAFALGVPVVTTSEGVEGLPAEDGVHAGVCEDDAGLIGHTVALLGDPALRARRRRAARALVEAVCAPGVTLDGIEAVHDRILGVASGPS